MAEQLNSPQKKQKYGSAKIFLGVRANYPRDKTIQALFEEQAAQFPNKVAVSDGVDCISYEALNQQANRLAHYLRSLGLEDEAPVAFYLRRGIKTIIAMLGILKAGGAYLPIDSDSPRERIEAMLEDSAASILLTQESLMPTASSAVEKQTHCMLVSLSHNERIQQECSSNLSSTKEQNALAYIIYTSGSTGKPKGVEITHRGVVSLIKGMGYVLPQADARFAQTSNIAFDAATFEVWGALLSAATLFVVQKEVLLSPDDLEQYIIDHHINVMWLTSGLFNRIFLAKPDLFKTLYCLLIGGENLNRHIVGRLLRSSAKPERIVNGYGPTENTTFSLCHDIKSLPEGSGVPLGKPIANKTCYVLDERMQPVKEGEIGELYVGGDGVARGYLNNKALNKASFIENPFVTGDVGFNQTLYRTGDFVKCLLGGDLEFIGRRDSQVKIRGFRIELEGVSVAITQYPAVEQATVALYTDKADADKQPVAFVMFKPGVDGPEELKKLRGFLQKKLPSYMVPTFFEAVSEFPLDQNGKINHRYLLEHYGVPLQKLTPSETPHTELEAILLSIWQEVFDAKTIGIKDNFFTLGGDSLRAMDVVAKSHKKRLDINVTQIFECPTVAGLAKIATISQHKKNKKKVPGLSFQANDNLACLLTPLQQGILLHSSSPRQCTKEYLVQTSFNIFSELDVNLFKRAWELMVKRHDVLRMSFRWDQNSQPMQYVEKNVEIPWVYHDWTVYKSKERTAKVKRLLKKDFEKGFDLSVPPLLRVSLVRIQSAKFFLVFTQHHLVVDGRSLEVFLQELFYVYRCLVKKEPLNLPESSAYFDFVAWLSRQRLDKARKYWRSVLAGFNTMTPLNFTKCWQSNPDPEKAKYARQVKLLSVHKSSAIRAYLKVTQLTLSTLVQAAWALLLSHYSGERDVVFGMIVNLHPIGVDVKNLLGLTINTVPVRIELDEDLDTLSYLKKIKKMTGELLQHAHCPLLEIKKCSDIESSDGLFNTIMAVENYSSYPDLGLMTDRVVVKDESHYPLAVQIFPDEKLGVEIVYDETLFSADFIHRMHAHFSKLLMGFLNYPYQKALSIPWLSQLEKQQALLDWNNTNIDFTADNVTIIDLFERQSLKTPKNVAISLGSQKMTYEVLNEKVNKTARYFKSVVEGSSKLIAVFLERELNLIVSVLAVLKLGLAYVPIDPLYPAERIDQIFQEAKPGLVVTQTYLLHYLNDINKQSNLVFLDKVGDAIDQQDKNNLACPVSPSDLAYVIFTSGSTGKPKGVMIEHASLVNFINAMNKLFEINESDRFAQVTTLAFDISALEIYLPLLHGAQLHLLPCKSQFDAEKFSCFLEQNDINFLQATPGVYQALLNVRPSIFQNRKLLCGGEALPYKLMRRLTRQTDFAWNMYGPTETTIWSTVYKLKPGSRAPYALIGKPIANTKVYVLDDQCRLLPIGVIGELYIAGEGLARGYLNQNDLTEERFVQTAEYGRLYKTGDLVRWLLDGNLEYIGRIDNQIKFRGHRGELSEIENSITQYSGVERAIVSKVALGEKEYLFAYIKLEASKCLFNLAKLREFLGRTLPYCFIPTKFFMVDDFPYTSNGKVDRKALGGEADAVQALSGIYEAPTNKYERQICSLFSKVLDLPLDQIARFNNFFELGGDSFSAMFFINLVEKELCVSLAIADFFRHPTPYAQAKLIAPRTSTHETI